MTSGVYIRNDPDILKIQKQAYRKQAYYNEYTHRVDRNGVLIKMKLSFDEWWKVWEESGHWEQRGNKKGCYCMSRHNDIGHYEIGNVFIQLHATNVGEKEQPNKPCSVDGIRVYPSVKALRTELGHGHLGYRHPNFHYIQEYP